MAVIEIIGQFIFDGRLHPTGIVGSKIHTQGDLVHGGKLHTVALTGEEVGILLQPRQRLTAVDAVELHGQGRGQVIPGHKLHHPPQACQFPESGGDLHGLFGGDPLDGAQPLRLLFDDRQRVGAEALHKACGGGRAYAADDPAGEVGDDLILPLRHPALHQLGGDLGAVAGVVDPGARYCHLLAGAYAGDAAHHGEHLALIGDKAQHRVAVFFILKDQMLYGTLHRAALAHALTSC